MGCVVTSIRRVKYLLLLIEPVAFLIECPSYKRSIIQIDKCQKSPPRLTSGCHNFGVTWPLLCLDQMIAFSVLKWKIWFAFCCS